MSRQNKKIKIVVRRSLLERVAAWMEQQPIVRIWVRLNQSATILSLAIALVAFVLAYIKYSADGQKNNEDHIAKAWEVVARMSGKQANGGQVSALEYLVDHQVSLGHVDLHQTYLANANLEGADLEGANLAGADLTRANLRHAQLAHADLRKAILVHADLSGADFEAANLSGAVLAFAKIDIAVITAKYARQADITGAEFVYVNDADRQQWDLYGDTLGESSAADDAQKFIDGMCGNENYLHQQNKELPFVIHSRRCVHPIDYKQFSAGPFFPSPFFLLIPPATDEVVCPLDIHQVAMLPCCHVAMLPCCRGAGRCRYCAGPLCRCGRAVGRAQLAGASRRVKLKCLSAQIRLSACRSRAAL